MEGKKKLIQTTHQSTHGRMGRTFFFFLILYTRHENNRNNNNNNIMRIRIGRPSRRENRVEKHSSRYFRRSRRQTAISVWIPRVRVSDIL